MTELTPGTGPDRDLDPDIEHPRGTLAIVAVFGALFALGWIAMYVWGFLGRGATH